MVEKIKINDHGDCIYNEEDALDILYNNPEFIRISLYFFETNFAPVLLPLAASPSHAILKDLFIKTMFN